MVGVFMLVPASFGDQLRLSYIRYFGVFLTCASVDHVCFVFDRVFQSEKIFHFFGLPNDGEGKINSCKFL